MNRPKLICKVCDGGELKGKRTYRMSVPVVLIGYIFLIPSLLGILVGVMGLVGTSRVSSSGDARSDARVSADLRTQAIPEEIISAVVNKHAPATIDKSHLSDEQKNALEAAVLSRQMESVGKGVGTAVAGGLSIGLIVLFFCSGLLGWLLVMKKRILKCGSCGATVAAD